MSEKQLEDMNLDELRQAAEAVTDEAVAEAQPVEVEQEPAQAEPGQETLEQVRARLESAEKALRDTKAWGTRVSQEAAALRRAQEEAARAALKPQILDVNPELADAIRYVATDDQMRYQKEQANHNEAWGNIVRTAIPDIDQLLENEEFHQAMHELKAKVEGWDDPIIAIREINAEIRARTVAQAQQAASVAKAEQKRSAMAVPTSGARQSLSSDSGEADLMRKLQSMSSADFAKEVRRVSMGQ